VGTLMRDLALTSSTSLPPRQTSSARRGMLEKEKFLNPTVASVFTQLEEEFKVFVSLMDNSSFNDPLEFYSSNENEVPIFSAVARVLAIQAISATAKRLYSVGSRFSRFIGKC